MQSKYGFDDKDRPEQEKKEAETRREQAESDSASREFTMRKAREEEFRARYGDITEDILQDYLQVHQNDILRDSSLHFMQWWRSEELLGWACIKVWIYSSDVHRDLQGGIITDGYGGAYHDPASERYASSVIYLVALDPSNPRRILVNPDIPQSALLASTLRKHLYGVSVEALPPEKAKLHPV